MAMASSPTVASLASRVASQSPIGCGLVWSDVTGDYDMTAANVVNKTGGRRTARIRRLSPWSFNSSILAVVYEHPIMPMEDFTAMSPLPDGHKWPVYIFQSDFGRGVATHRARGRRNEWIYAVKKEPLADFATEVSAYENNVFQVPEFMISFRQAGVIDINKDGSSITFLRRGKDPIITTINEVRSNKKNLADRDSLMLALWDVVKEYPSQASDLLNPGEVEMSKGIEAMRGAAANTPADSTTTTTDDSGKTTSTTADDDDDDDDGKPANKGSAGSSFPMKPVKGVKSALHGAYPAASATAAKPKHNSRQHQAHY